MTDKLHIPVWTTWAWFCSEAAQRWPELPAPPAGPKNCWPEAVVWLHRHGKAAEAAELLKAASGARANALLCAARFGLINERGGTLFDLILHAPGDQEYVLYQAVQYGLITSAEMRCACG